MENGMKITLKKYGALTQVYGNDELIYSSALTIKAEKHHLEKIIKFLGMKDVEIEEKSKATD
jgi:hypothetical protein